MEKKRNIQVLGHILPLSKADPAQNCILFKFLEIYFHTIKGHNLSKFYQDWIWGEKQVVSLFYFICISYIYSRISVIRNKMGLLLKFPFRSLNVLTVKRRTLLICNDSFMSCFILVDSRYFVKLIFKYNAIFTLMLLSCALYFCSFLCSCSLYLHSVTKFLFFVLEI